MNRIGTALILPQPGLAIAGLAHWLGISGWFVLAGLLLAVALPALWLADTLTPS